MAMNRVAIVGGGAAGLAAAVTAARLGAYVTVLEHGDRVGRKLLSTGNGRCNFTHEAITADKYFSDCPQTVEYIVNQYPAERILEFMEEIGVSWVCRGGYYYPASNQAEAVLFCLRTACEEQKVQLRCGCEVSRITPFKGGFLVREGAKDNFYHRVILACGGQAAPFTGSDGSGYELARSLGHQICPVFPALTGLTSEKSRLKGLAGIRAGARAALYAEGRPVAEDSGEVQFTDQALSGIVIFQLSHLAAENLRAGRRTEIRLNFLPETSKKEAASLLRRRREQLGQRPVGEWGIGLIHRKLWERLVQSAGLRPERLAEELTEDEFQRLCRAITSFTIPVKGCLGFDRAQVTAGGVSLTEVEQDTLESKLVPGLYLAGELLNVDGLCGGYNLHWAWASGMTAGEAAAL